MAKIITESEYNEVDKVRMKAADEHMWAAFENRMRALINCCLAPVIELTTEDREALLHEELMLGHAVRRIEKLEMALFKPDYGKHRNVFDDIDDSFSHAKTMLHDKEQKLRDEL